MVQILLTCLSFFSFQDNLKLNLFDPPSGFSEEEPLREALFLQRMQSYLQGVLEVNSFLALAIRENRPELVRNLFAGRLTMADAVRLSPLFQSGWLEPPAYVPKWAADLRRLAALIAYTAFMSNVKLEKVTLNRVIEIEEEISNESYKY